jgi:hypothetical protein
MCCLCFLVWCLVAVVTCLLSDAVPVPLLAPCLCGCACVHVACVRVPVFACMPMTFDLCVCTIKCWSTLRMIALQHVSVCECVCVCVCVCVCYVCVFL